MHLNNMPDGTLKPSVVFVSSETGLTIKMTTKYLQHQHYYLRNYLRDYYSLGLPSMGPQNGFLTKTRKC